MKHQTRKRGLLRIPSPAQLQLNAATGALPVYTLLSQLPVRTSLEFLNHRIMRNNKPLSPYTAKFWVDLLRGNRYLKLHDIPVTDWSLPSQPQPYHRGLMNKRVTYSRSPCALLLTGIWKPPLRATDSMFYTLSTFVQLI